VLFEEKITEKIIESAIEIHRHESQLLTYLRLSDKKVGLILNFYVSLMKDGVRRLVL
jgi:hypothetical protein